MCSAHVLLSGEEGDTPTNSRSDTPYSHASTTETVSLREYDVDEHFMPMGSDVRESHQNLYGTGIRQSLVIAAIVAGVGYNSYFPVFRPEEIPRYAKIITFAATTLLSISDFSLVLNTFLDFISCSHLRSQMSQFRQRARYSIGLVLLDVGVSLCSVVCGTLATSSSFANAIDAGSSGPLATGIWLIQSMIVSYHLYLFAVKMQKKIAKYWVRFGPNCLISFAMHSKIELRRDLEELIDRIEYTSTPQVMQLLETLPSHRPPIFHARSIQEVTQYARDLLRKSEDETGRSKKERMLIKCIRYSLYGFMLWVCLIFSSTQMGSVHNALREDIIPHQLRDIYADFSAANQENVISASVVTLCIQYLHSGLPAVDHLMLQVVRTLSELIEWVDAQRALRHLIVLSAAVFLGAFSFSSIYFSAQNGMDNIDFKLSYETPIPGIASSIVQSTGGMSYLGIKLSVPLITSGVAILINMASLIDLFNRAKNYILGGGRIISTWWRPYTVPQTTSYDLQVKLVLLLFLKTVRRTIDSRYYDMPEPVQSDTPPVQADNTLSRRMRDCLVLANYYYNKAREADTADTKSTDSIVGDAPLRFPPGVQDESTYYEDSSDTDDDERYLSFA